MSDNIITATNPKALSRSIELLTQQKVIAIPTDTVYGFSANALSAIAVDQVYLLKNRPTKQPLAIFISSLDDLEKLTTEIPSKARPILEKFWPGALTAVFKKNPTTLIYGSDQTVAVRIPNHPFCNQLLNAIKKPLISTSANLSGANTPVTAQQLNLEFNHQIPLIIDGGPNQTNRASTIIDFTQDKPTLLREGIISFDVLRQYLPDLILKV